MPTATQTLYAQQQAKQHAHEVELHTCAAREFPVGSPVQWVHVYGKPPVKAVVVAIGKVYRDMVSTSWELETKSGARHTVHVHRLEPQEPQAVRVMKATNVGKSDGVLLEIVANELNAKARPTCFEPPSQETWP